MTQTKVLTGEKARAAILKGVKAVCDVVLPTLGPDSKTVLTYGTYGREPRILDDGYAASQVIEPLDEFENLVVTAFRETSKQTNQEAGDGTTTTMTIAGRLIANVLDKLSTTSNSFVPSARLSMQKIKRDLLDLSKQVQEKIKARSKKIESLEDLEKVAVISLGDEELGKLVAGICYEVGVDGFVDVVEGFQKEITSEIIKGARFPAKVAAKAFVNNPKKHEMVAEQCAVLLTNYKLDNVEQAKDVFSKLVPNNKKLVVIAPDYSIDVLNAMFNTVFQPLQNSDGTKTIARSGIDIFPVKAPSLRTDQFDDLAVFFSATFINKDTGKKLQNVEDNDLGFIDKLVVKDADTREDAVAIGGRGGKEARMKVGDKDYVVTSPVAERIAMLKAQVVEERVESNKKLLERRIASLASAVAVIRVGSPSRAETIPLKLKIEDAQYACMGALEEGYVKGGGLCLKEIAEELKASELTAALKAPYFQIQENSGGNLEISDDVIDPAKVVRSAVKNAISVAASFITIHALIPEIRQKDPAEGYEAIAQALMVYNRLWNKKEAIYKENEIEMKIDEMAQHDAIIQNEA